MALDIAEAMCRKLHPLPTICADMAHLPVATGCMDAVVSSLAFQWLEAPLPALQEMARVLRPGSVLAFTTFTHGTLEPLVSLTTACDVPLALERFPDASVWHHHLTEAGFTVTEHDTTSHTTHYPSLHALLRSFRAIGAGASRPARPLTRGDLRQLESAWQGDYRLGWQVTGFLCNRV
jgi:malonyl-CoA O-methyltransferase